MTDAVATPVAPEGTTTGQGANAPATPGAPVQLDKPLEPDYSKLDWNKVDLNQHPGYRTIQSQWTKTHQAALSERQQAQQAAQFYAQQAEQYKQALRQKELELSPDDYARKEAELKHALEEGEIAKRNYQALMAQLQQQQAEAEARAQQEAQKRADMEMLAEDAGIPLQTLLDANPPTYRDAQKVALKLRDQLQVEKAKAAEERKEANKPDVGGGAIVPGMTALEKQLEEAEAAGNSLEIARIGRLLRQELKNRQK